MIKFISIFLFTVTPSQRPFYIRLSHLSTILFVCLLYPVFRDYRRNGVLNVYVFIDFIFTTGIN